MTLLITGGCGWVGSFLTLYLLKNNIVNDIKILDVIEPATQFIEKMNNRKIKFFKNNLDDKDKLETILEDVEQVIHLAAIADVKKCKNEPEFSKKINVQGTKNLLDAIKSSNVKKFIFASTMSAIYGDATNFDEKNTVEPVTEYGKQKLEAELLVKDFARNSHVKSIILRKSNLYGIGLTVKQNVVAAFVKNGMSSGLITISGAGNQYRSFLNIKDACLAYSLAISKNIEKDYEIFNIAGPDVFTLNELSLKVKNQILEQSSKDVEINREQIPSVSDDPVKPKISTQKAQKILEYIPEIHVEKGISELIEYYKKQ